MRAVLRRIHISLGVHGGNPRKYPNNSYRTESFRVIPHAETTSIATKPAYRELEMAKPPTTFSSRLSAVTPAAL